jgi:septum formation protein
VLSVKDTGIPPTPDRPVDAIADAFVGDYGRRLVLASASPARLATLRAAGVAPEVQVSGVDESLVSSSDPARLAVELAMMKARTVAARLDTAPAWVIGCDSVLALDHEIHGKPADAAEATRRWMAMRGRSGVLHTGHCLVDTGTGREVARSAQTVVHFADPSPEEVADYVATGEPLQVAGAFTLDGLGGAFVRGVEGDPHTVVGIGLPLLREMFAELGVRWTELWRMFPPG